MNLTEHKKFDPDLIMAIVVGLILIAIASVGFDHYYEFNDDVLMKDILSGAYTGTPSALNVQMLSPISAVISALYGIIPQCPWYGLFLCICHYLCVILMAYKAIHMSDRIFAKVTAAAVVLLFSTAILLPHIVMAQYTVTVAVISAVAAMFFYTIPADADDKTFLAHAVFPVLLVVLSYQIRSEMLLLMLPYIAAAGIARWSREDHPFIRSTVRRYLIVVLAIAAGMGASYIVDRASYSSEEWRGFLSEFDARTELYDYQYVPPYEDHSEFYDSIGLDATQVALLQNYDYGIDDRIDGDVLGEVASYAAGLRGETVSGRIRDALYEYMYRISHFTDGAYALLTLFLYGMLIIAVIMRKESTPAHKTVILLIRAGGLLVFRSVSWMYIVYGRRLPDRIVHSLYIIECVILFAMIVTEYTGKIREGRYMQLIMVVVLIAGGLIMLPFTMSDLRSRVNAQDEINRVGRAIDTYCRKHPDNFYYEDVYTTITNGETFNEKMFKDRDDTYKNYDLIGGWIVNSPLYREKISRYGITDAGTDMLTRDDILFIMADVYDTGWIEEYYAGRGYDADVRRVDAITDGIGVYEVRPAENSQN